MLNCRTDIEISPVFNTPLKSAKMQSNVGVLGLYHCEEAEYLHKKLTYAKLRSRLYSRQPLPSCAVFWSRLLNLIPKTQTWNSV